MDLITIYKDDGCEVKTFDFIVNYLENYINNTNILLPLEQEELLSFVLDIISKKQTLKNKKIITTSCVPILHRGNIFNLTEEYSKLEDAVLLLSEAFDKTKGKLSSEWKDQLSNYIKAHYFLTFQKNCDIIFFVEKIYGISLEIVLYEDNEIFLLPISLNEDDFYQKLS